MVERVLLVALLIDTAVQVELGREGGREGNETEELTAAK